LDGTDNLGVILDEEAAAAPTVGAAAFVFNCNGVSRRGAEGTEAEERPILRLSVSLWLCVRTLSGLS